MMEKLSLQSEKICANVRALLASVEAAMLSDAQYAELERLQSEVIRLCQVGDEDGALAAEKIIDALQPA